MIVAPLITANEVYPALERLAASARTELVMSFREFDPATKLREPELRARGLDTWADLLVWVARRDVRLRLILSDFDPLFLQDMHRKAWRAASAFADTLTGDVQILCAPHGQQAGRVWHILLRKQIAQALKALEADDPTRLTPVQRGVLANGPVLRPVTIHQKFAVADGARAIIGGLDISERFFDTSEHDRAPDQTWHDVSVVVNDADFSGALRAHFGDTWNGALQAGAASLADRALPIAEKTRPQAPHDLRLIRTMSDPAQGLFRLAPRTLFGDHETVILSMIRDARQHIYIETQYLRHAPIADALADAARQSADLQLILMLPAASDDILYKDDSAPETRHAHALQHHAVDKIAKAYGDRIAVISPAQPWRTDGTVKTLEAAGPVYVHAKVILVDDAVGLVGSANLNGRSMRWDTEASVMFRNSEAVADLRRKLAAKWLGESPLGDPARAATWAQSATQNASVPPEARHTYVLPFPMEHSAAVSRRMRFVPPEMF